MAAPGRGEVPAQGVGGLVPPEVPGQHPRNLVEIFGGSAAAQIFVALALGTSLHAFGDRLDLATLIVVLTLGSMLGGISPVPGGMGVVEAGMIIGLTAAGINETDAVAAVFVQRLFTAYLPPIWGWFVLVWMRKKEYLVTGSRDRCRRRRRAGAISAGGTGQPDPGQERKFPSRPSRPTLTPTSAASSMPQVAPAVAVGP